MKKNTHHCGECQQTVAKNYCRQCDEFFWQGHHVNCSTWENKDQWQHIGHRTY